MEQFARITRMVGSSWIECLQNKKVAVFGLGGVGSYVVEALVRNGIGELVLVDHDIIDITNLNRQLYALHSTIGMNKVDVARARCLDINPNLKITTYQQFYLPDQGMETIFEDCDFVVDAIDTMSSKLALIQYCLQHNIPFISSMGMANRMDPTCVTICDLMKTSYDPVAKIMRSLVRKHHIKGKIPVVWSSEQPTVQTKVIYEDGITRKQKMPPASSPFVPSAAGLAIASYAIKQLLKK